MILSRKCHGPAIPADHALIPFYKCTLGAQVELNGQGLSSMVPIGKANHVRAGEQTDSVVLNVQRMHRQVL